MTVNYSKNGKATAEVDVIHNNTSQELINIYSDKLKLILKDYTDAICDRTSWLTPFGLLISIVLTFVTADFKPRAMGMNADFWAAIFFMLGVICIIWLVISILKLKRAISVDDVVETIKNTNAVSANKAQNGFLAKLKNLI